MTSGGSALAGQPHLAEIEPALRTRPRDHRDRTSSRRRRHRPGRELLHELHIPAPTPFPGWVIFPFGRTDAQATWTFGSIGGLPLVLMLGLAGIAVLAFVGSFLATFGIWVSADWWRTLVLVGAGCSALLFLLHLGLGRSRRSLSTRC